ncbi:MAG TPA: SRPBCC family protein [Pantanalinema sp.]
MPTPSPSQPQGLRAAIALCAGGLLLSMAAPARAEAFFDSLSADEQAKVDHGEIIVKVEKTDAPLKNFLVVGRIEASAADVFRVFTDYDNYSKIFNIKETKVLGREGNVLNIRAAFQLPWPIGEKWLVNETRLQPERYSFVYKRTEGNITEYAGSLRIVPKGPRVCEAYYIAKTDPGIPGLPTWLLNRFQESMLPSSIQSVRDQLKRPKKAP